MAAHLLQQTEAFRAAPKAGAGRLPLPIGGEGRGEGATCGIGCDGSSIFRPGIEVGA